MAHAHCMLDTQGYKYAHSGCVMFIRMLKWLHECSSTLRYTYCTLPVLFLEIHRVLIRTVRWQVWSVLATELPELRGNI